MLQPPRQHITLTAKTSDHLFCPDLVQRIVTIWLFQSSRLSIAHNLPYLACTTAPSILAKLQEGCLATLAIYLYQKLTAKRNRPRVFNTWLVLSFLLLLLLVLGRLVFLLLPRRAGLGCCCFLVLACLAIAIITAIVWSLALDSEKASQMPKEP